AKDLPDAFAPGTGCANRSLGTDGPPVGFNCFNTVRSNLSIQGFGVVKERHAELLGGFDESFNHTSRTSIPILRGERTGHEGRGVEIWVELGTLRWRYIAAGNTHAVLDFGSRTEPNCFRFSAG